MPEREEIDRSHPPAAAKPPQNAAAAKRSTRVSPAGNAAAAPPHHHGDTRSPRIPPAWTSRLRCLHPNLQAAATGMCQPGQAKKEASPAGSEEPRPNEAARVIMQRAARDQGFANSLLQVATNNWSGGAHDGATALQGCRSQPEQPRQRRQRQQWSQVRPRRQQRQEQRQQRREGQQQKW
ncbi:hypothetical protein HPB50_005344 [Hyalomma asiaticum]|uniref:Uncharacterized protein n=1 Tax=Hyalomma asiaticum TaxID=266040 RepID=A0ACB7SNK4_HYAAI|nr:hypothetical protein HPB50_005344 [Hyalomma asiaticum]